MPSINKDHAYAIAKKLGATIVTRKKAHDLALIYRNCILIAAFGIRRVSDRNPGHGYIPKELHLSPRQAILLAQCTMTVEQWLGILRDGGWVDEDDSAETPGNCASPSLLGDDCQRDDTQDAVSFLVQHEQPWCVAILSPHDKTQIDLEDVFMGITNQDEKGVAGTWD